MYNEERMMQFFNALSTICVEFFGIEAACFASADKRFSYQTE